MVKYFAAHKLRFPPRSQGHQAAVEVTWQPLALKRVWEVLHNPFSAGTYVYGRTHVGTHAWPGKVPRPQGGSRQLKPAEWPIVHPDHHPGYLSWEQFLRHQQQLEDNRTVRDEGRRGAVREGSALLQGIVLCGHCGRRISVRYWKGQVPGYECGHLRARFAGKTCQSLRGDRLDRAVAQALLEAITPAQLELSLATLEAVEAQEQQIEQQWQRRLERGRYEVELARRRYLAVDPDTRLVARHLEHDWNEQLKALEPVECDYAQSQSRQVSPVGVQAREKILALAQDLPALWHAPTTTPVERKQLLRFAD